MATIASKRPRALRRARALASSHEGVLLLILIGALIVLAQQSDRFLTAGNLLNQGRLMAEVGLVALPMTLIIITGGIDLSPYWLRAVQGTLILITVLADLMRRRRQMRAR